MRFQDRYEAGRMLAAKFAAYTGQPDVRVLGLSRGGLPVAFEIAQTLKAPLDIFLVRKLGVPGHEELAMGAITTGGVCVLDDEVVSYLNIASETIAEAAAHEREKLEQQERVYHLSHPALEVSGRTVILVTDGLAASSTMRAAVTALRAQRPARIIAAVPSASPSTCDELRAQVDEVAGDRSPKPTLAPWYHDFTQITDEEVRALLARTRQPARRVA